MEFITCVNSDFVQSIGLVLKSYKAMGLIGLDGSVGTHRCLLEPNNF